MKNNIIKQAGAFLLSAFCFLLSARADLTAVVTPGYQFPLDGSIAPSYDLLNQLALPTIQIYGTVGGSNTLAVGSVTGTQLSTSVADGVTIGWNNGLPPSLEVLAAGLWGKGLTNDGTSTLRLNINTSTLAFQLNTNALGLTNFSLTINTNFFYAQVWTPWTVYSLPTNGWGTNSSGVWTNPANAWGYTNIVPVTNLLVNGNPAYALNTNDRIPLLSYTQGTNPTLATLPAIGQFLAAQNLRKVATLIFYATNNFVTNTVTFTGASVWDRLGTNTLLDPLLGFSVTNVSVPALMTNVAAAINASSGFYRAQVWDTNSLDIYQPVQFYPWSSLQVEMNYQAQTNNLFILAPKYIVTAAEAPVLQLQNEAWPSTVVSNYGSGWVYGTNYFTNYTWSSWPALGQSIGCPLTNLPEGSMTWTNWGKNNEFGRLVYAVKRENSGMFSGTWTVTGTASNRWGQTATSVNTVKIK